jgi:hypothetical protein
MAPSDLHPGRPARGRLKGAVHRLWPRLYTLLLQLRYQQNRQQSQTHDLVGTVSRRAQEQGISPERIEAWHRALPSDLLEAANRGHFNAAMLSDGLLRPRWWVDALDIDTPVADQKWQAMDRLLSEIVHATRARGLPVAAAFFPSRLQYDATLFDPSVPNLWRQVGFEMRAAWLGGESEEQRRLRAWAARESVPFLDLTPVFREEGRRRPLTFPRDEHWNAQGHAVAAAAIAEWLRTARPFPFL